MPTKKKVTEKKDDFLKKDGVKCAACEKVIENKEGYILSSMSKRISIRPGVYSEQFVTHVLGKYEHGKNYHICPECFLMALGVEA